MIKTDENPNLPELQDSIISSVKKLVGIPEDDDSFDIDIMFHVNAASSILYQLGVLQKPFTVRSLDDTYEDMFPEGPEDVVNQVKMYFVYKTKLGFDNSTLSASVIEVLKKSIDEIEHRLMWEYNPSDTFD